MDNKAYAIQLCLLDDYAKKQEIPEHQLAFTLKDKDHSGATLLVHSAGDSEEHSGSGHPTLSMLKEIAFLQFPNILPSELYAVFGRVADGATPRTTAHVEVRKNLARDTLDHVVVCANPEYQI